MMAEALLAPVHVPSTCPSLARMRLTVPVEKLDTHRSSPSKTMSTGLVMLVERSEAASVGVHHCCMKARLLARLMAPSCVRVTKAAICSRGTGEDGL